MNINSIFFRTASVFIMFSFLHLPIAQASMVSTETFLSHQAQTDPRAQVMALLQKDEVVQKLQEYGVNPEEARARIASLSDQEIATLNSKIGELPAGADAGEAILGTVLVVFIVLLITDILCWTKVFKFTRCAQ